MVTLFPHDEKYSRRLKDNADYDVLLPINLGKSIRVKKYFSNLYKTNKVDLHYIPDFWDYIEQHPDDLLNAFFTLKASHVPWDTTIHKEKTFYDLYLLSEKGAKIIEPLYYKLHKFWTGKFGEKWRADFTKESSEFFNDAVSRESVHDDLHKSVAFYDQPAFKFLQDPEQTTVWVCPNKFANTTEHIRQRVVIEEAQTLAIERILSKAKGKLSPNIAYFKMLQGLIDRLAPLWMTIYILNNYFIFVNYKENYYEKIDI